MGEVEKAVLFMYNFGDHGILIIIISGWCVLRCALMNGKVSYADQPVPAGIIQSLDCGPTSSHFTPLLMFDSHAIEF